MFEDPIVAEVRKIREQLASKFGFDVHAIFEDMRSRQSQFGARLVRQPSRGTQESPPAVVSEPDTGTPVG